MAMQSASWESLVWNTVTLRPYVFIFLIAFLITAVRDLGGLRALWFLVWGWSVAFVAEYASTRIGVPFGLYHYTGSTAGIELYISNVPLFDSISFVFLAYASFCLARRALGSGRRAAIVPLAGILMMLLDVVIDPLAVRGDRWFLGRIFYYPAGGVYFGVPLSNFAGWVLVGWIIVGGYAWATRDAGGFTSRGGAPGPGVAVYYGVLAFNLAITLWIGEWALFSAGVLVQAAGFLLLYELSAGSRRRDSVGSEPRGPGASRPAYEERSR
jgi:putative membrane protein